MSDAGRDDREVAGKLIAAAAQHADKLSKITLKGGMVGRVTWLLIVFCIAATGMVWSVKDTWITLAGLLSIVVVVCFLGTKLIRFAGENPQAALMEGAELLMHEQMKLQMGMKSQPVLEALPSEDASEPILHPQLDKPDIIDLPDEGSDPIDPGTAIPAIEGQSAGDDPRDLPIVPGPSKRPVRKRKD